MTRTLVPGFPRPVALTPIQETALRNLPTAAERRTNFPNEHTRCAYRIDIQDFMTFAGVTALTNLATSTQAHVIAWQQAFKRRGLRLGTTRKKLSALSSLFECLYDKQSSKFNNIDGVQRSTTLSG